MHAVIIDALGPDGVFTRFGYTWTRWAHPPGAGSRTSARISPTS